MTVGVSGLSGVEDKSLEERRFGRWEARVLQGVSERVLISPSIRAGIVLERMRVNQEIKITSEWRVMTRGWSNFHWQAVGWEEVLIKQMQLKLVSREKTFSKLCFSGRFLKGSQMTENFISADFLYSMSQGELSYLYGIVLYFSKHLNIYYLHICSTVRWKQTSHVVPLSSFGKLGIHW